MRQAAKLPSAPRTRVQRLSPKRYACRLPLELASRLEALCELHPEKTRSQLLVDLVGLGLVEVERARSGSSASAAGFAADARQPIYLLTGPFAEFHGLSRKHYLAMEQALDKDEPPVASPMDAYVLGDVE